MLKFLYPTEYSESVYCFDYDRAAKDGITTLLFDIDNTLVPHDAPADARCIAHMEMLRERGYRLYIISNNHEPRVKSFCEKTGMRYVCDAGKPKKSGYETALKNAGAEKEEAVFFGDQIFTDIWGAKRAGIRCVLVKPIDRGTDKLNIVLKRILEKPIIRAFFREKGLAKEAYFQ